MRTPAILALSLAALLVPCSALDPSPQPDASEKPDTAKVEDAPMDVDILKDYKRINGPEFPAPPSDFRKGHVTPRKFDAKGLTKTSTGFELVMPNQAPIPTPTVYRGRLFVSGGFSSKEYYCFDAKTGKPIWGIDIDDDGPTTCGVEDGVVVFNTESCTVFAVEAETGKQLWSYWLGDPLLCTPSVANGIVFTSYPRQMDAEAVRIQDQQPAKAAGKKSARNTTTKPLPKMPENIPSITHALIAIELKTGKILWQRWLDSDVMSAPVVSDGKLFVATFGGNLYSFSPSTGEVLTAKKTRATSAPVIVGKDIFVTKRTDSGKQTPTEALAKGDVAMKAAPAKLLEKQADYLDSKVQAASGYAAKGKVLDAGNGFAGGAPATANADAASGNVGQASVSTLQSFQGSRAVHYGGNNFNCLGDELVCTNAVSGTKQWSIKLEGDLKAEGGYLAAPPAVAGGYIFLATLKGEVLQVAPKGGEIARRYALGHPTRWQPVIVDGLLYASTMDGKVICQDTGDAKNTGWYTWGGDSARTGVRSTEGN
jgi:Ca-activated chloride channel homolog